MKNDLKRKVLMLCILLAVFCTTFVGVNNTFVSAEEESGFTFEQVRPECEKLTQDDFLEGFFSEDGKNLTIENYFDNANQGFYTYDEFLINLTHTYHIKSIIHKICL